MTDRIFPGFGNSPRNNAVPEARDPASTILPGLAFSVHKKPNFSTSIKVASSGKEYRHTRTPFPRWDFELNYEFIENNRLRRNSLETILGFFLEMRGSYGTFLFKDPDDFNSVDSPLGVGDGTTTEFFFTRHMGSFSERVGQVDTSNRIEVRVDGVAEDPTIVLPNKVVFDTAPSPGAIISADLQFFYVCRFLEDMVDFEKFYQDLWTLQTCNIRSVL